MPDTHLSRRRFLQTAKLAIGGLGLGACRPNGEAALEHGLPALTHWTEPAGDYLGMMRVNGDKAFAAGFAMRPLEETARDTLEWFNAQDVERRELRSGLSPEREAELLAAYRG